VWVSRGSLLNPPKKKVKSGDNFYLGAKNYSLEGCEIEYSAKAVKGKLAFDPSDSEGILKGELLGLPYCPNTGRGAPDFDSAELSVDWTSSSLNEHVEVRFKDHLGDATCKSRGNVSFYEFER